MPKKITKKQAIDTEKRKQKFSDGLQKLIEEHEIGVVAVLDTLKDVPNGYKPVIRYVDLKK